MKIEILKEKIKDFYKISEEEFFDLISKEDIIDKYWYETGECDYSIYNKKEYVFISYSCFKKYSRGFVKSTYKVLNSKKINSILDFGAGIGATTVLLSELFNCSDIYYQNVDGEQKEFAKTIFNDRIKTVDDIIYADLMCFFELFEHIKKPIELLNKVIEVKPKFISVTNSFGAKAYGHHSEFINDNDIICNKKMGRMFNSTLRRSGYKRHDEIKFFNGRPTIWVLSI